MTEIENQGYIFFSSAEESIKQSNGQIKIIKEELVGLISLFFKKLLTL